MQLANRATLGAIADAGVVPGDIDGIVMPSPTSPVVAEELVTNLEPGSRVIASSRRAYGGTVRREWRPDDLVCILTYRGPSKLWFSRKCEQALEAS